MRRGGKKNAIGARVSELPGNVIQYRPEALNVQLLAGILKAAILEKPITAKIGRSERSEPCYSAMTFNVGSTL